MDWLAPLKVFVGFPPIVQSTMFLTDDNSTRVVWTEGGECDGWTVQRNSKVRLESKQPCHLLDIVVCRIKQPERERSVRDANVRLVFNATESEYGDTFFQSGAS